MAAPQTCKEFLDLCRKSEVIDPARLDAFLAAQPRLPDDPRVLAGVMVQQNLLTRFQAAQLLHGKYRGFVLNGLRILEQLGVGGMGAVYLCEQVTLRRRVAVKVLPTKQAQDRVARERFFREARAVAALDHPNIIRIHDCASNSDIHYLMMEYVEGVDLQARIERDGPMSVPVAVGAVAQAAAGLAHAHSRGLVHRDVKPSNLLMDRDGVVKILDMGLARFFSNPQDNLTQQLDGGAVVGTVDFLAPEQAIESSKVDARADIYSLGATLYTLLSGKPPFGGTTTQKLINHQVKVPPPLHESRPDVPVELDLVVRRMMAKKPEDRYASADEVVAALAPWIPAEPTPGSSPNLRPSRSGVIPHSMSEMIPKPAAGAAPPRPRGSGTALTGGFVGRVPRRGWWVGGIAGVVVVCLAILVLQGPTRDRLPPDGKSLAQAKADPTTPNPPPGPPEVEPKIAPPANPKLPPPKVEPTIDPKEDPRPGPVTPFDPNLPPEGRVRTQFPWADFAPVALKMQGTQLLETRGTGRFPADWKAGSWDRASTVETALESVEGQPAVVQRNLQGKPSAMLFTPALSFHPGAAYELTLEYRTTGTARGRVVLRDDLMQQRNVLELPPTQGDWKAVHFWAEGFPQSISGRFELHLVLAGPGVSQAFRKIEVREVPRPQAAQGPPRVGGDDFSTLPRFGVHVQGQQVLNATGTRRWPGGWNGYCWRAGTEGEGVIEEVGTLPMLAMRNLAGEPSFQFSNNQLLQGLTPGKPYRLRIRYLAEASALGEVQLRPQAQGVNYFAGALLHPTRGQIETITIDLTPGSPEGYSLVLQNSAAGEKTTIFLKSVELFEAEPQRGRPVASLGVGGMAPFKWTVREQERIYQEGAGLPADWELRPTRNRGVAQASLEVVNKSPTLTLENLEGDANITLMSNRNLATLRAGHRYRLAVQYASGPNRMATLSVTDERFGPLERLQLVPTDGQFREAALTFRASVDQPVRLMLQNGARPEDSKLMLRSLELIDLGQ